MPETTTKRIAQWPTLRGGTLVVSLQEPVPGERFVDIRRWHGPDESALQPGIHGITLSEGEIPDLWAALGTLGMGASAAGDEPGADTPLASVPVAVAATVPEPAAILELDPVPKAEPAAPVAAATSGPEPVGAPADETAGHAEPVRARRLGISRMWQ